MTDVVLAAAGAFTVAALNELRATIRARQADRDRAERLRDAIAERDASLTAAARQGEANARS